MVLMMGCSTFLNTDCTYSLSTAHLFTSVKSHSDSSFIILVTLPGIPDPVLTLIDSGATSNFVDSSLSPHSNFNCISLHSPIALCLFDGKPAMSGFIHEYLNTSLTFADSSLQDISLLVMKLHPLATIILGLLWLCSTRPIINWTTLLITFPLGTTSTLPTVMVTMACTMIPPLNILDTIPKLHTALMPPPLSVPGSRLSLPSSGYIPNMVTGHSLHILMLPPDVTSPTTPIPNLSGYEQTFDMEVNQYFFVQSQRRIFPLSLLNLLP